MGSSHQADNSKDPFYVQGLLIVEVTKRILIRRAGISASKIESSFKLKPITEFMERMRISSLDKFETTTYVSTINFYKDLKDMNAHKAVGAVVTYIEGKYIAELLKCLSYPVDDPRDEETLLDGCGTMCNLIAGNFKSGLAQLGYKELEMSHFSSYHNEVLEGVEYDITQEEKYQADIMVDGVKRLVVDLTMGDVPMV
ncbi:hypothetical protein MNBD_UNCLBAC01-2110 [hydrothermal vent metagenome]|uniref:Chemotaxis phosphatase CheX-like domain-containing protein n=1 Tax=hydrothermal vent metagenome TaxID=652676 RepID=A0A3B1E0Q3_9ZZZZ